MESGTILRGGWVLVLALGLSVGCSKKETEGSGSGSGVTAPAAAEDKGSGKTKTTIKIEDVRSAYASEVDDMTKMNDPMDKKVAAFVAKLGKPEKEEAGKKIWHALDGDGCTRVEIESSGALTERTAEKAECGI
jgi:hypothetical protein